MSMNMPPEMPSRSPRDPDSDGSGTNLALAAIAVVVVLGGLLLFTGGKKADMPSTAEQPRTETPAAPPQQAPTSPAPPSTDDGKR